MLFKQRQNLASVSSSMSASIGRGRIADSVSDPQAESSRSAHPRRAQRLAEHRPGEYACVELAVLTARVDASAVHRGRHDQPAAGERPRASSDRRTRTARHRRRPSAARAARSPGARSERRLETGAFELLDPVRGCPPGRGLRRPCVAPLSPSSIAPRIARSYTSLGQGPERDDSKQEPDRARLRLDDREASQVHRDSAIGVLTVVRRPTTSTSDRSGARKVQVLPELQEQHAASHQATPDKRGES